MRKWAWVVILLYVAILSGIAVALASLAVKDVPGDAIGVIVVSWVAIMAACQAGLLVVPLRVHSRRPITKRHLFWPVTVAVLSCIAMAVGMFLAAWETIAHSDLAGRDAEQMLFYTGLGIVAVWIVWAFIFGFYTGGRQPATFISRTTRFLIGGSILELLVAVPTHVIARARNYCCAGWLTVWGLGLGASVMLFAFGPGVFALFVRRYHALKRPAAPDHAELQRDTEPANEAPPDV
jgi:hypothetical protein